MVTCRFKFCSRLRNVLFPTLIAACFENEENKKIIEQEVSCALLENYIEVRGDFFCCKSSLTYPSPGRFCRASLSARWFLLCEILLKLPLSLPCVIVPLPEKWSSNYRNCVNLFDVVNNKRIVCHFTGTNIRSSSRSLVTLSERKTFRLVFN